MGLKARETIRRPRQEVWATVTDWRNAAGWMTGVDELRPLEESPVGEGSRLAFRSRGSERETTVAAWQPAEKLTLRSRQGGITADYVYAFEDCPEGTRVSLDAACRGHGLAWKLLAPLIGVLMARADSGQLRALKTLVEERGAETS